MKLSAEIFRHNNEHLSTCVRLYEDIVPKELCTKLIEFFEESLTLKIDDHRKQSREMQFMGDPRREAIAYKDFLCDLIYPLGERYERELHAICRKGYTPTDEPMTTMWPTGFRSLQIQKYTPESKGYSAVHIEAGPNHVQKYLAVIVYLNDVYDNGGETVFPMCGRAIEPEAGAVVVFPTGIPFYHCGNPSKIDKYIITTWFEFLPGVWPLPK